MHRWIVNLTLALLLLSAALVGRGALATMVVLMTLMATARATGAPTPAHQAGHRP